VVVKLLLEKGAKLETKDNNSQTLLSQAAENGHEAVVKLLLEKGAKLETKDKGGRTLLLYTVGNGYDAAVKLLLAKNGINLDLRDNFS
jgi:ankyrin repeat protein